MTLIHVPRITLRCLRCRWVFTIRLDDEPLCATCGTSDPKDFHELIEADFADPARYADFGPGLPGAMPPNLPRPPIADLRYAHLLDRNRR